jgi:hypothetical protein
MGPCMTTKSSSTDDSKIPTSEEQYKNSKIIPDKRNDKNGYGKGKSNKSVQSVSVIKSNNEIESLLGKIEDTYNQAVGMKTRKPSKAFSDKLHELEALIKVLKQQFYSDKEGKLSEYEVKFKDLSNKAALLKIY